MAQAEEKFKKLLGRQSKTLAAAVAEYKKRYNRNPPKGFDEWWKFAQDHDVLIVDEYDGMIEDLEPFWELSGEEFRRRVEQVSSLPSIDIVRLRNGEAVAVNLEKGFEDPEASARAQGFQEMILSFQHKLPDMDFPINAKAEGRILVPWEHRHFPNLTLQDSSSAFIIFCAFTPDWHGTGSVWEAFRRTCVPSDPARQLFSSVRPIMVNQSTVPSLSPLDVTTSAEFTFTPTTNGKYSFCQNPWAHYTQGHFFSDWRTIPVLYPVFSPAKSLGFGDIRIPSHYYYGSTPKYTYGWDAVNLILKEVDDWEVPWEDKTEKIFWRGATTGGGSSPVGFAPQYQRHRFLKMATDQSGANQTIVFADPPGSSTYVSASVPAHQLNEDLLDVAFTTSLDFDNYPGGLEAMVEEYRFDEPVPLGEHWKHKYLIDFDGMGYSARFMALLASDSAVLKSTVYQEYFSDWIQPWLHYIPVSSSYKEIYNIHAFFSGPSESTLAASVNTSTPMDRRRSVDGDRRLRRIARAGKHWKRTIGRQVDMEVYVYRLCLEYARLWSDNRDSMDYV
ncbi:glycosyltransferase family 90 protein [Jaapia argillacea MUCL 33604]|uniref:Glycosyltransferase family 90 protein n=1 Tax=Jaapia argillacea MUCL 33604 TaxID=933084 RepID=A0A067PZ73_9AGAM|nr:glycosyltransferase family 90 protein [Jaapia argillacea MUCL 33604]